MAVQGSAPTAQLRRFIGWHGPGCPLASTLLLYGAAFSLLIPGPIRLAGAQELTPGPTFRNETRFICKSVDVRNSLDAFSKLDNCEVIEGFLQILLFDNVSEGDFLKMQFPLLTEITDYLLLYRVSGLRSIGQLFPNLSVIRGQNLFFSNAFVIFEMSSLQEIGLYSLTDITHGAVRIDKNPSLCFVHTIDWDRIVHDKKETSFIKSLKPENECPICPGNVDAKADGENNSVTVACPKAPRTSGDNFEKDKHLCWNKRHCQKICPDNCTACNDLGHCCGPLCLGGCSNDDPNDCTVCKNFAVETERKRECTQSCPPSYFKYLDRRCITKEECINMPKPIEFHATNEIAYKIFNQSCILHCPPNYKSVNNTCVHCGGRCEKICDGINVDSIALAKQLRGCTHIKGSLEIQIRAGTNVVNVLEENLNMIEEISGYLKVVRSFSLVSLNFLKSLKRIKGEKLESQKYVFVVLDNQNLQELWDWKNKTLKIHNGSLFFHFNPKLCIYKIEKLQEVAMPHLPHFTDLEVAPNSNGDQIACNVTDLPVKITYVDSNYITLEWNQFEMEDQRSLLAYTLYCTEAPSQNITLYDGRDACGQDNWRVYDVQNQPSEKKIVQPLPNLKPYTYYAFYVKTYTIASARTGAQSEIMYFRTNASMPSPPQNLQVISNSSDSLKISWLPPAHPNGDITHYIVSGKKHLNGDMYSKDRDYCADPPTKTEAPQVIQPTLSPKSNDTCVCAENPERTLSINEMEESARIKFEDELQNKVYIRRKDPIRTKRHTAAHPFPNNTESMSPSFRNNVIQNVTENGTDIWESFSFPVYGKTDFFIDKLHHFTSYVINVQACRKKEGENDVESRCSSTSMQTQRTLKKRGADRITKVHITNQSLDAVTVAWEPPQDPNGVIFTISLEYKALDNDNAKVYPECITSKNFTNDSTHRITLPIPGNYSLRVFATTSAGEGEYSPYIYFYINESSSNTVVIVSVILIIFLGVLLFGGWIYRKRQKEKENMRLIQSVNPEYVPSVYIPDEWEVPRKKIELIKELGQGSFGMVWEGVAHDIKGQPEVRCAIKTVNEHATNRERLEFLNEASVMKAFDTAHVVRLLGVVSQGQPTLVIMELMANGDLKSYLRSHRPDIENYDPSLIKHPPTLKQILQMAIEIADGMAYLSAKKFVHRDLAARNCMVSENLTVKIGDFGMTRDIYETDYYRKGTKGLLPVRWMAPESLKDGVFTSSSDVWSYGVVLWEMATLASQPYQGLSNDQVLRYVIDGGVMERPENCPDKLYTLMRYCWQHKPTARPTFLKLCQLLLDDASPNFAQVSFYHSPAGAEARASRPTPSPSQDDHQTTPLRKVSDRLGGYTPSESQDSDELDIDTHHQFPSISESGVGVTATANGYVSGCPTTGASTTQC